MQTGYMVTFFVAICLASLAIAAAHVIAYRRPGWNSTVHALELERRRLLKNLVIGFIFYGALAAITLSLTPEEPVIIFWAGFLVFLVAAGASNIPYVNRIFHPARLWHLTDDRGQLFTIDRSPVVWATRQDAQDAADGTMRILTDDDHPQPSPDLTPIQRSTVTTS